MALFVAGINLGLRIGDLLRLQVKHFLYEDGSTKDRFEIVEQKTKKRNVVRINQEVKKAIQLVKDNVSYYDNLNTYLIYNLRNPASSVVRHNFSQ